MSLFSQCAPIIGVTGSAEDHYYAAPGGSDGLGHTVSVGGNISNPCLKKWT